MKFDNLWPTCLTSRLQFLFPMRPGWVLYRPYVRLSAFPQEDELNRISIVKELVKQRPISFQVVAIS